MSYLMDALNNLKDFGVFDVLLPFLLIFTIIFAVLRKSQILGDKKQYDVAVALVIGLFTVVVTPIVELINTAIPNVAVVVVAIVMALILIGVMGGKVSWIGGRLSGWIAFISFAIVIYIFGSASDWWNHRLPPWLDWLNDPQTQSTIVVLLVFGIVIWYVTREEKPDGDGKSKIMEELGNMFCKG